MMERYDRWRYQRIFLNIGYDKRSDNGVTDSGRKIMGRKGIGKLATFSLTNTVRVLSSKDHKKQVVFWISKESLKMMRSRMQLIRMLLFSMKTFIEEWYWDKAGAYRSKEKDYSQL